MIKIIKEGKKPQKLTPIYTIKCPLCGCVFECETSDFHSLSRGLDGTFTIFCPCCNIIIEDSTNTVDVKFKEDIQA